MPRLAANLSTLFPEFDFLERFEAAARAGFRYVEYQFPYQWAPQEIARRARDAGVQVVLHNLPAGDFAKGERGIACLPGREGEFREGVERAIAYAKEVNCARLNCLAGLAPASAEHFGVLVENVRHAARKLGAAALSLTLEPINTRSVPGFFLTRSSQAVDVLNAAGEGNASICKSWKAISRARWSGSSAVSAISSSPTCPTGTSPAPARSTTRSCSSISTASVTRGGSDANTIPGVTRWKA
jgi:hydroxypyruvate isomerase